MSIKIDTISNAHNASSLRDHYSKLLDEKSKFQSNQKDASISPDNKYIIAFHSLYHTLPLFDEDMKGDEELITLARDPFDRCEARFEHEKSLGHFPSSLPDALSFTSCISSGLCLFSHPSTIHGFEDMGLEDVVRVLKSNKRVELEKISDIKEELINSLLIIAEECSSNHQTRLLCGKSNKCGGGGAEVLEEAKRVVVAEYELVGMFDRMEETFWLLNTLYPAYFGPLRPLPFYEKFKPPPSKVEDSLVKGKELREKVLGLNEQDVKLITFVKFILDLKKDACVLSTGFTNPEAFMKRVKGSGLVVEDPNNLLHIRDDVKNKLTHFVS